MPSIRHTRLYWDQPRVTPFSHIDLDHEGTAFQESLSTMGVELDDAVLVIRGKKDGNDVEFTIGNLKTAGADNGMVLIHRQEYEDLFGDNIRLGRIASRDEYRLLLDCELVPDAETGHAFTIRVTEEQGGYS
jgi:hypothetical protein